MNDHHNSIYVHIIFIYWEKFPLWLFWVSSAIVLNPILCMCYSSVHFFKTNWVVWNIYSCIVWYKYALKYMIDWHHYALLSLALRCCFCTFGTLWLSAWWNSSFSVDGRNLHQHLCCSFLYWYSCMLYCIVFILLGIRRWIGTRILHQTVAGEYGGVGGVGDIMRCYSVRVVGSLMLQETG